MAGWGTSKGWDPYAPMGAMDPRASSAAVAQKNDAAIRASLQQQMTAGNGQQDQAAKNRQQALDWTSGRGDAVMNDALTNAALGRLQGVATGADAPFTDAVKNQMLSEQAGMNATSAGTAAESLRQQAAALGGSTADPQYQAKLRQIQSQTQSSNANARGQINTTAQLQNFGARQTANNSLLSSRFGQLGMANSQYNQGANYLANETFDGEHQSGVATPNVYYFGAKPMQGEAYEPPSVQKPGGGVQNTGGATATRPQPQQPIGTYSNSPVASNRLQGPSQFDSLGDYNNTTQSTYRRQGPALPTGYNPNLPVY